MEIRYIHHSSFLVETDSVLLLFDYFSGELPPLCAKKPLYILSSHRHPDHFSTDIFRISHPDVHYILSKDIRKKYNERFLLSHGATEAQLKNTVFLPAHEALRLPLFTVSTLRSTDEGVAFLIEVDGETLYHAGDLNLWLWEEDTAETEEARMMTAAFEAELKLVSGRSFDAAFLPLDPRQGALFYRGFDRFMRETDTRAAYPMHCWEDFSVIPRLQALPVSAPYRDRIAPPSFYGA